MSNTPTSSSAGAASKAFLIAAVVLGVLSTVLAFAFIQNSAGTDHGPEVWIVVAKRDLTPAITLDPDRDLKPEKIPARFAALAQQSLSWEGRQAYKGERVNRNIFQDQPVALGDVAAVGQLVLEKGHFALAVPADPGIIIPGDQVRLIFARPTAVSAVTTNAARLPYDAVIIGPEEGYKVLAVGGYLVRTRQQVLSSDQSNQNSSMKTVTLQVTDVQAKEIMGALGSLGSSMKATLLLCPSANTIPVESGISVTPGTKP